MHPEVAESLARRSKLAASLMDALPGEENPPPPAHVPPRSSKRRRTNVVATTKRQQAIQQRDANPFAALADTDSDEEEIRRDEEERQARRRLDAAKDLFKPATFGVKVPPANDETASETKKGNAGFALAPATFRAPSIPQHDSDYDEL